MHKHFPHYFQNEMMDCGPACLRMIAKHYGRHYTLQTLRKKCFITREGVSMLGISDAAESIGFRTNGVRITLKQLEEEAKLPCISQAFFGSVLHNESMRLKRSCMFWFVGVALKLSK